MDTSSTLIVCGHHGEGGIAIDLNKDLFPDWYNNLLYNFYNKPEPKYLTVKEVASLYGEEVDYDFYTVLHGWITAPKSIKVDGYFIKKVEQKEFRNVRKKEK